MSLISEERLSGSAYIEKVMRGWTVSAGFSVRPAETNWHMVFVKHVGGSTALVVGPLTRSGIASWGEGAEILWIQFRLGVFMPHFPTKRYLNEEQTLPEASSKR